MIFLFAIMTLIQSESLCIIHGRIQNAYNHLQIHSMKSLVYIYKLFCKQTSTHRNTYIHTHAPMQMHTHSDTHTLSISLSLSLSYTHTHTHTRKVTHTQTNTHWSSLTPSGSRAILLILVRSRKHKCSIQFGEMGEGRTDVENSANLLHLVQPAARREPNSMQAPPTKPATGDTPGDCPTEDDKVADR